jgi:hypothetical protein
LAAQNLGARKPAAGRQGRRHRRGRFVAGLVAATLAIAVGTPLLCRAGGLAWPVSLLTEARMVAGTLILKSRDA